MQNNSNEKSTQVIITDVLQYLRTTLESPDTYALRLYFTDTQEASLTVINTYNSVPLTTALTVEQSNVLWSHVVESQHELANSYDLLVEIREPSAFTTRSFRLTKKTRMSAAVLVKQKSLTQETYDFLETAYRAGINIIIEGKTGSGRSRFLNFLMDSAKDYKPTLLVNSFPEMLFGFNRSEITEIRSDNPSALVPQLLNMNQPRIVMDDVFIPEPLMKEIVKKAKAETQFIATGYRNLSVVSASGNDDLSSIHNEHPFELRVHVNIGWNDDETQLRFDVISVEQIVHQTVGNRVTTSNRLLFNHEGRVAEPTRTLRRKMESCTQKIDKKTSSHAPLLESNEVPALVSINAEQKEQMADHRNALHEHFQTQSPSLRKKFEEIDKILSKF